jgi:hypothetical protein
VGDDDPLDALPRGRLGDLEDLVRAEVAGGQHHVVPGDQLKHRGDVGADVPLVVEHLDGRRLDAVRLEVVLDRRPRRRYRAWRVKCAARPLIARVDGGEPHDPRAGTRRYLDGHRIHPADRAVERDPAEHVRALRCGRAPGRAPGRARRAARGLADGLRPLGGRVVMGLEDEPRHALIVESPGQGDVVDAPVHHVGGDVYMQVIAVGDEITGSFGGRGVIHGTNDLLPLFSCQQSC